MTHRPHECEWMTCHDACGFYSEPRERRVACADIIRRRECPFQDDTTPTTQTAEHADE